MVVEVEKREREEEKGRNEVETVTFSANAKTRPEREKKEKIRNQGIMMTIPYYLVELKTRRGRLTKSMKAKEQNNSSFPFPSGLPH